MHLAVVPLGSPRECREPRHYGFVPVSFPHRPTRCGRCLTEAARGRKDPPVSRSG